LTHLPSIHKFGEGFIVFITKSETDHTKIVAIVYRTDDIGNKPIQTLNVGSNEDLYPTDCVFAGIDQRIYIALNKRTKSSEPYMTEIVCFLFGQDRVIGRATRSLTTIRALEKATSKYLAAFTLTNIMIYSLNDLS